MSIDYAREQRRFVTFKRALTIAQKAGDPQKVLDACDTFFKYYSVNNVPLPDAWHRWQRAQEDALQARNMNGKGWRW